jgi:hypothetical protein
MESLLTRARTTGDRIIPVRVDARVAEAPPGAPPSDHATRMATTIWTLERVFSETCPASLAKLAIVPDGGPQSAPGLHVKLDVAWTEKPKWTSFYGMKIEFDVTLRASATGERATFHLTMPPPDQPSMTTRTRSVFVIGGEPAAEGTLDDRVYASMSARAFDRLYDELHSLLFRGDPRVPLRGEEEGP